MNPEPLSPRIRKSYQRIFVQSHHTHLKNKNKNICFWERPSGIPLHKEKTLVGLGFRYHQPVLGFSQKKTIADCPFAAKTCPAKSPKRCFSGHRAEEWQRGRGLPQDHFKKRHALVCFSDLIYALIEFIVFIFFSI